MERVMAALTDQHGELERMLSGLAAADWDRPSRCPGWTVADVVLHLAQTDELALASGRGAFAEAVVAARRTAAGQPPRDMDEAAELAVAAERGPSGPDVRERWRRSAAAVRAMLAGCDPRQRLEWVAGELPARTLATTRLAEAWIHTGDVAHAFGTEQEGGERLWHIARLAWRTLPYAFARAAHAPAGAVAVELVAPGGSAWVFAAEERAPTVVRGPALDFCLVAARRVTAEETDLVAEGPDGQAALALVRTFA